MSRERILQLMRARLRWAFGLTAFLLLSCMGYLGLPPPPFCESKRQGERGMSTNRNARVLAGGLLAAAGLLGSTVSQGQEEQALEEIVVTATRRAESLVNVPISIAAYSQDYLDNLGMRSIEDVASRTPGLTFEVSGSASSPGRSQIYIRGISSSAGAATTGVYIDDTPIQARTAGFTSTNAYPELFDIERVEVLRGPQGTLFGADSQGGTVRFITPSPSVTDRSFYSRAQLASFDDGGVGHELGIAGGAPIIAETLGFRASLYQTENAGYIDHISRFSGNTILSKDSNRSTAYSGKVALRYEPSDKLIIEPSIFTQKLERHDASRVWVLLSANSEQKYVNADTLPSPGEDELLLPALSVEYELNDSTVLHFNASYLDREYHNRPDYSQFANRLVTGSPIVTDPANYAIGLFDDEQESTTGEARIQYSNPESRLQWVAGLFYRTSKQLDVEQVPMPNFAQVWLDARGVPYTDIFGFPLTENFSVFTDFVSTKDTQLAFYTQADYDVTDSLRLILGIRASRTEFSFNSSTAGPFAGGGSGSGKQEETPVTPKFGLTYALDGQSNLYATAAQGFRPGGAQSRADICNANLVPYGLSSVPPTYESDSVWSYELGYKSRLLQGRLSIDTSAFHIVWEDRQSVVGLPSCGQSFIINAGKAESQGFDMSAQYLVTDNLSVAGSLGVVDTEFTDEVILGTATIGEKGTPIDEDIRPWIATVRGDYGFPLWNRDAYVRLEYQYASKPEDSDSLMIGAEVVPGLKASHKVNLRLGMHWNDVEFTVFVNNMFNYDEYAHYNTEGSLLYAVPTPPRAVGLTATYRP